MTCSQLSSTTRMRRLPMASTSVSNSGRPGFSRRPSADSSEAMTRSASVTAASSTSQTPAPVPSSSSAATCRASRVLPAPPEPTRVTKRACSMRARISVQLGLPADEGGDLLGQVVGQIGILQRAQRREFGGQPGCGDLEDVLGPAQVLQAVQAEIAELDLLQQRRA